MTDWIVVGIYCDGPGDDGDARRHPPQVVANFRRRLDGDGARYWAKLHTSNDSPEPLNDKLVWLNPDNEVVEQAPGGDRRSHRALETFTCSVCGFNLPRRWEDVEKLLATAYDLPRPRVLLREWMNWIR
jgi:hypothetical protein